MKKLLIAITAVLAAVTMSIPAQAAGLKPTVTSVDNTKPAAGGGTPITVSGTNFDTVTSVTVDNSYATLSSKSAKTLVFIAPQHALGIATVLITNPAGTVTFNLNYSPQRRPVVPTPTIPETMKLNGSVTIMASDPSWLVTITTDTPKICLTKKNVIKALKRGTCQLNVDINPDTAQGSNPNWRGKLVIDSILVK